MSNLSPLREFRLSSVPPLTLARAACLFGVNKSTFLRWEAKHVPAERVLEIERITGVSRHELRPDIFPAEEARA